MAVVQISRIQIRRGKAKAGTGLPQLASGEMAWAIDTQELWIGTGSVAEGAPFVDNIRVLTENDISANGSILDLLQYVYKNDSDTIITGPNANLPISRPLQARLDDRVNVLDFGAKGNGTGDDTAALQRAINQLFLNTIKASEDTDAGVKSRVVLEIPAGVYNITSTLYIPSYATIVGAGPEKTIIEYSGSGTAIKLVNDSSLIGSYDPEPTLGITQPKHISITGLSLFTNTNNQVAIQLDSVSDCTFENLRVEGNWDGTFQINSRAFNMSAVSSIVTCQNNKFKNITVTGFNYAVFSKYDIIDNVFEGCTFTNLRQGFVLGGDPAVDEYSLGTGEGFGPVGEQYGPRNTIILNTKFDNVKRHGVYLYIGSGTLVDNCTFSNVGCNGGGNQTAAYPQVYYRQFKNAVANMRSDRYRDLARPTTEFSRTPYVPEASGHVTYSSPSLLTLGDEIAQTTSGSYAALFRLPSSTDAFGVPSQAAGSGIPTNYDFPGSITYKIEYTYISNQYNFSRRGVITIMADLIHATIQLSDEYDYAGSENGDQSYKLDFRASFLEYNGTAYTGGFGQRPHSIQLKYSNELIDDHGTFIYSYTSQS